MKISEHFADFLKTAENLETFSPGLFVTDRSQDSSEPRKLSLCFKYTLIVMFSSKASNIYFSSPKVVINLVKYCHQLTSVSLYGYEDLSDIVLHYISGHDEAGDHQGPGLTRLTSITLPDRSYITEVGVQSLVQHLPQLEILEFPGNLGKVFDMDWEPKFCDKLKLINFSQLMTVSSGGVEVLIFISTIFRIIPLSRQKMSYWRPKSNAGLHLKSRNCKSYNHQ